MQAVDLTFDFDLATEQLLALSEFAGARPEVRDVLLELFESGVEVLRTDCEDLTATAGQIRIHAQLSDRLLDVLTACRAGNFDRMTVDRVIHGAGVSNDC